MHKDESSTALAPCEGLPNREASKLGEIGGGRSGGTPLCCGVTPAKVTRSGLADRSEGSANRSEGLRWPGPVDKSEGFGWVALAQGQQIKVRGLGGPGWSRASRCK